MGTMRARRSHRARIARHAAVSTSLALLSDRSLRVLVAAAPVLGTGIGGTSAMLDVDGTPVFVKRVPLCELEVLPENIRSTANVFRLPTYYQYGVGLAGFGAWRELAAHTMTTNWVLAGQCAAFPLMYHWRVLAGPPRPPAAADRAGIDRLVEYWDGSPAVRGRLEAIATAAASLVLFLEYVPQTLNNWLAAQSARGGAAVGSACAMVLRRLLSDVQFMNSRGLVHFDAHFGNILTDGRRLYFADFGLATSAAFELSARERVFLDGNAGHDACHSVTQLVNWVATGVGGRSGRDEFIRRCADPTDTAADFGRAAPAVAAIKPFAPVAVVINAFYRELHLGCRNTAYPAAEARRAWAAAIRASGAPGQE